MLCCVVRRYSASTPNPLTLRCLDFIFERNEDFVMQYLFSHSIKLRGLPLSATTVSLRHLPRCLRSAVTCGKTPSTVTSSEPFKIFAVFCYAIKTNSRTIHSQVLQPAFEGKGADKLVFSSTRHENPFSDK